MPLGDPAFGEEPSGMARGRRYIVRHRAGEYVPGIACGSGQAGAAVRQSALPSLVVWSPGWWSGAVGGMFEPVSVSSDRPRRRPTQQLPFQTAPNATNSCWVNKAWAIKAA